ncbi:probable glutamate receptor [Panulirus ornatus]|uniref:probable glutamate receptor n=1 Tax=Panulirus ornatus TaxID=150431 RepID=UPI003A89527B
MVHLLEVLAITMNFTYKYIRPPDGSWGGKLENGSWTGMVGMVGRKEVDFGLGPFSVRIFRKEMVDFTREIMIDDHKLIARRGRPEVDPWGFLLPLKPLVWAVVLTALLMVPAVVFLFSSYSGLKSTSTNDQSSNVMFTYVRVLLQQDYLEPPDLWWKRLVLGAWMIMTLVLTRSYAGTLMSLLAVRHIPEPYHSIRQVLDDPSVTMIWESDTSKVHYFRAAKSGIFREIGDSEKEGRIKFVKSFKLYSSLDKWVRQGDHTLMLETLLGRVLRSQDFSHKGRCDFYGAREVFLPTMFAMIGQKGSPLVPSMNKRIKWVTQTGLYYHWLKVAMPNVSYCDNPPAKIAVSNSLAFSNTWGMFAVLLGGHAISLFVLCLELLSASLLLDNATTLAS